MTSLDLTALNNKEQKLIEDLPSVRNQKVEDDFRDYFTTQVSKKYTFTSRYLAANPKPTFFHQKELMPQRYRALG